LRKIVALFICCNSLFSSSLNDYGVLGYFSTPSAFNLSDPSYAISIVKNKPDRKIILTTSPFNWLDANIFYVDIARKPYGGGYLQSYKDKGLSFKITPGDILGHKFAIGFNDIAGTNFFQSEYLVFSNIEGRLEYSFGLGWGAYSSGATIKNPLIRFNKNFSRRPVDTRDRGGNLSFNKLFSGENAAMFWGASYKLNNNLNILIESDPTNTDTDIPYKQVKSNHNFGISYQKENFSFKASLKRGNTIGVQFTLRENLQHFYSNNQEKNNITTYSYKEVRRILQLHNIGLKKVSQNSAQRLYDVRQNSYHNHRDVDEMIAFYNSRLDKGDQRDEVVVSQYIHGMKITTNTYDSMYGYLKESQNKSTNDESLLYRLNDKFPIIRNNISPKIRNYIAGREGFYFGGVFLEDDLQVIFAENLFFSLNLKYSLWDNFENLVYPPIDTYPAQVRSDNKDYFREFGKGISVGRMEINYFKSFKEKHFLKTSIGILEEMFGGIGFEYVYAPEKSYLAAGFEAFHVQKREYAMRFGFKEFKNTLARSFIQVTEPRTDIRMKISFGEYLATDKGYTMEISRIFPNGIEFGAFFTRTNVSKEDFGEGSFDKGIRVRIPFLNIYNQKRSLSNFIWKPLTKDPGALLYKSNELLNEVNRFRFK